MQAMRVRDRYRDTDADHVIVSHAEIRDALGPHSKADG
jgi:hypothetical protein